MSDTHASPPRSQVPSMIQELLKVAHPLVQYFYTSRPMNSEQAYFNPFHYKHCSELSDRYEFNTPSIWSTHFFSEIIIALMYS